jgi:hypothetical protein
MLREFSFPQSITTVRPFYRARLKQPTDMVTFIGQRVHKPEYKAEVAASTAA